MNIRGLTSDVMLDRLGDLVPLLVVAILGSILLEAAVYFFFAKVLRSKHALPYTLVAPAALAILLFTVYPFFYNVRLAFSDLRLKTMSCYIPNTDITNAPCSLGQAALNADVEITLDDLPLRVEPAETAEVIRLLQPGDEVFVSGRSKTVGYVVSTGVATTEEGRVCNPLDRECVANQRNAQALIETQDQRDWWEVKTDDSTVGWIPNNTYFLAGDAEIYAESLAGGDVLGNASQGQEVRFIRRESETWYEVETADGLTGWILTEPIRANLYIAENEATLYAAKDATEEATGTLTPDAEARLLRSEPILWTAVTLEDGTIGWLSSEIRTTEIYHSGESEIAVYEELGALTAPTSTLPAESTVSIISQESQTWYQVTLVDGGLGWVNVQPTTGEALTITDDAEIMSESGGTDSIGAVESGEIAVLLSSLLVEDETWSNILTDTGINGWIQAEPTETTEVTYLPDLTVIFDEIGGTANETPLTAGTQVQLLDQAQGTWYEIQTPEGDSGWVIAEPESLTEQYSTRAETLVYAEFGDLDAQISTLPANTPLTISEQREQPWYQVQTADRLIGWTTAAPREVVTVFSLNEDSEIYAQPNRAAEVVGTGLDGDRVENLGSQTAYWYQVRVAGENPDDEAIIGWVSAQPKERITTEREIILYSLDYGWSNFKRVFVDSDPVTGEILGWGRLLQTQNSTFPRLMLNTVIWTVLNVFFHTVFGMILALILNKEGLKFRGLYRAIIILPWAIPQVILALTWRGEFNFQFGFVNTLLQEIGMNPVNWLQSPTEAFAAVTFVNIWLGIPFYMVTLLGGLQSISGDYYEAAQIDGANPWDSFWSITVPLIRPVAVPIVTLDVIWTFNNFNVIYMITEGRPNESTNILVTALYNAAFGRNGQFQLGFASAFSLVIFFVLFLFAVTWVTQSGALKGIYDK